MNVPRPISSVSCFSLYYRFMPLILKLLVFVIDFEEYLQTAHSPVLTILFFVKMIRFSKL